MIFYLSSFIVYTLELYSQFKRDREYQFERSRDDKRRAKIVISFAVVIPILLVCLCVFIFVKKKKKQATRQTPITPAASRGNFAICFRRDGFEHYLYCLVYMVLIVGSIQGSKLNCSHIFTFSFYILAVTQRQPDPSVYFCNTFPPPGMLFFVLIS